MHNDIIYRPGSIGEGRLATATLGSVEDGRSISSLWLLSMESQRQIHQILLHIHVHLVLRLVMYLCLNLRGGS